MPVVLLAPSFFQYIVLPSKCSPCTIKLYDRPLCTVIPARSGVISEPLFSTLIPVIFALSWILIVTVAVTSLNSFPAAFKCPFGIVAFNFTVVVPAGKLAGTTSPFVDGIFTPFCVSSNVHVIELSLTSLVPFIAFKK